jgi:hypothetical protein
VLRSAITLGVVAGVVFALKRRYRGRATYALLMIAFLYSRLLLDFLDGGPLSLLYPLVNVGIGLYHPTELIVRETAGTTGVSEPPPTVGVSSPSRDQITYLLVTGCGVFAGLLFFVLCGADFLPDQTGRVPLTFESYRCSSNYCCLYTSLTPAVRRRGSVTRCDHHRQEFLVFLFDPHTV